MKPLAIFIAVANINPQRIPTPSTFLHMWHVFATVCAEIGVNARNREKVGLIVFGADSALEAYTGGFIIVIVVLVGQYPYAVSRLCAARCHEKQGAVSTLTLEKYQRTFIVHHFEL